MFAVVLLQEGRLLFVDLYGWSNNRNGTTIWEEVVSWLFHHDHLFNGHTEKEGLMILTDLPEGHVQDVGGLIQELDEKGLSESALIEQLENHTTEIIESFDKDSLQKAIAGGKLLKSVLMFLARQNFSPVGCLILAHQNGEEKT